MEVARTVKHVFPHEFVKAYAAHLKWSGKQEEQRLVREMTRAFWGTRVMEIVKKHDSGGLVWKIIKLTSTHKAKAKKRLHCVWQGKYEVWEKVVNKFKLTVDSLLHLELSCKFQIYVALDSLISTGAKSSTVSPIVLTGFSLVLAGFSLVFAGFSPLFCFVLGCGSLGYSIQNINGNKPRILTVDCYQKNISGNIRRGFVVYNLLPVDWEFDWWKKGNGNGKWEEATGFGTLIGGREEMGMGKLHCIIERKRKKRAYLGMTSEPLLAPFQIGVDSGELPG
ncbi:hypothetical protein Gotur_021013 [Gossypium turneri]